MFYNNEEFSYVMRNFPEMSERPEELKDDLFGVLFDSVEIRKSGRMNEMRVAILISLYGELR